MTAQAQQVLKRALLLPPIERAELIERVFNSFDYHGKDNFDTLWAREAENRIDAFDKGILKAVSAKKVFRKIEKSK
ncbi:MAG: hypothetical protein A3J83_04665 [Elusimicrobia bacterium RIFOXYA2_FULL_40_6]|nr:MAG: hypothetical protein A3J83_04665 [Elusimicrobia bacterium RIFOXYA2_FULL_40_6]